MRGPHASPKRSPSYSQLERCPSRNGDPAQADKHAHTCTGHKTEKGKNKTEQESDYVKIQDFLSTKDAKDK